MNLGDSWWRSPAATQPLRDRSNQQPQLYEPLPLRLDSVDKRACFGTKRQYDSSNRQRAAEVLSGNESANSKRRRSTFTVPDQEITECCATRRCCTLLSAEALSRCRAAVRENSSSSAQRKQYALTLVVRQTSCSADQGVDSCNVLKVWSRTHRGCASMPWLSNASNWFRHYVDIIMQRQCLR
jgi:hypothetical protein